MLNKSIGRLYYEKNVAFYLFVLLFAFGFLSGREHMQIALLVMSKLHLQLILSLIWLLHVGKTYFFLNQNLNTQDFSFLEKTIFLPKAQLLKEISSVTLYLNLPFNAYSLFILIVGLKEANYQGFLSFALLLLVINIFAAILIYFRFQQFYQMVSHKKWLNFSIKVPFPNLSILYYIRHLINNQPILYLSTKLYTLGMLFLAIYLYPTDDYDIRWISIFALISSAGYYSIGNEFLSFENRYMGFLRNFDISLFKRYSVIVTTAFVLNLPEMVLLFSKKPSDIKYFQISSEILFLWMVQVFWMLIFYLPNAHKQDFLNKFYYLGIIIFILIMFKIPLVSISFAILISSWLIFSRNYYKFEFPKSISS